MNKGIENFVTNRSSLGQTVKISRFNEINAVGAKGEVVPSVPKVKAPQEKVEFKYGKIRVSVKNAPHVRVYEEGGEMVLKFAKE